MKKNGRKKGGIIVISLLMFIFIISASVVVSVVRIGPDKISAYFSVFTFEKEFGRKKPLSTFNYDTLNELEKEAYICIFDNIEKHPQYIKVPMLSKSQFNNVFFAVKNDNPDMLCFSDSCNMITFWSSSLLELHYDYSYDKCQEMCSALMAKAEAVAAEAKADDEYGREIFIHDYLVKNCNYSEGDNDSNAYGCMIEGEAVCSGYSRAMMLLLSKVNIDSVLVGGTGITNSSGNISHMWNAVWIDGLPYQVDVTWDDPKNDNGEIISHLYFNLTSAEIGYDHIDASPVIDCTATEACYFEKIGMMFSEYTKNEIQAVEDRLLNNINNGINSVEFRFTNSDAYELAAGSLLNSTDAESDMYSVVRYIADNATREIDVTHVSFSQNDELRYMKLSFDFK